MEPQEKINRPRKKMLLDNFLGGIAWSFGVTIGGAVTITIIAIVLSNINYIPYIGDFVISITKYVSEHQSPFGF